MTFGTRLNKVRKSRGKTAKVVAEELGIALRTYRSYESNSRETSLSTLVKISKSLNVSIDYLLGLSSFIDSHEEFVDEPQ